MKHALIMLSFIALLTGCASGTASTSHPLDPRWTRHQSADVIPAQHTQADDEQGDVRHYHVFNASAQVASLNGFAETSAQQREAELARVCGQSRQQSDSGTSVRYEYFWGSHEHHPLLSAFTITPATDCPSTPASATAYHQH